MQCSSVGERRLAGYHERRNHLWCHFIGAVYCSVALNVLHALFEEIMMKYLEEEILVLWYAEAYLNSEPF